MLTAVEVSPQLAIPEGLFATSLRGLGQVVVLAGPNGAGKSRYLSLIATAIQHAVDGSVRLGSLESMYRSRCVERDNTALEHPHRARLDAAAQELEVGLQEARAIAGAITSSVPAPKVLRLEVAKAPGDVYDPIGYQAGQLDEIFRQLQMGEFAAIHQGLHVYLQRIAGALFNARHPDMAKDADVLKDGRTATAFNELLFALLGERVGFAVKNTRPEATLFGRILKTSELSSGQKLLIVWAICLHLQGATRLRDSILLVDEPEKHLHPAACLQVLDRIRSELGDHGQLWIATHSPAIVAHFGGESVYHVCDGKVVHAGTKVHVVMDGLLGGARARRQFSEFLADAEALAFQKFAAECFVGATVAGHRAGDPQEGQFAGIIQRTIEASKVMRVLDYGAGKGRFAVALAETIPLETAQLVEYFALNDPDHNAHADECLKNVGKLHADAVNHVSTEITDFFGSRAVDLIVMCNYLHEVSPNEWAQHFEKCERALRDRGGLLIMEDQEPSIGELPNKHGFLILNQGELRRLFGDDPGVNSVGAASQRLSAIFVPKDLLHKVTPHTLRDALTAVMQRSLKNVERLRANSAIDADENWKNGRAHARALMMHGNAALALSELNGGMSWNSQGSEVSAGR
jgi:energy-coupling factor transporter ATP-binding protein EcfA2/SAM-dependent methyltransferase